MVNSIFIVAIALLAQLLTATNVRLLSYIASFKREKKDLKIIFCRFRLLFVHLFLVFSVVLRLFRA